MIEPRFEAEHLIHIGDVVRIERTFQPMPREGDADPDYDWKLYHWAEITDEEELKAREPQPGTDPEWVAGKNHTHKWHLIETYPDKDAAIQAGLEFAGSL